MTVLATFKDGRILAKASISDCKSASSGAVYSSATVTDLRKVEQVVGVVFTSTAPQMNATAQDFTISQNSVGFSVYMSTGGTVSGEILVIGF